MGVIAAAVLCAIVTRLMGEKGAHGSLTKLIVGLFLTFTLVRPLTDLDLKGLTDWSDSYEAEAALAVSEGQSQTRTALAQLIKERTQAYILDKAQALNTALQVEVTLSDDDIPVPVKVKLSGKVSPYAKGQLETMIAEDLGIEKENQLWTSIS